nr:MAG TPA: STRUCTURAL MAINTENANCE OF CHROMOSOMES PROTEIN [Caudoviricetes sp.]
MKVAVKETDKLVFDLEMHQIDYNEQKKESLRKLISDKYNVPLRNVEINFKPITKNKDGETISLASDIISNIQDPKFQQSLFKEYIDTKGIEDVNLEDLYEIDNQINSLVSFDAYSKYRPYKIKYLKWSNYLSYGKDNYFDFSKLKGLVLLTGEPENTTGKTTLAIDLLRFALFGKASKSPTLESVFNRFKEDETEVIVEAGIEIDDNTYVIRRTITRPVKSKRTSKSKAKQTVEYFRLINDTYEMIENQVGEDSVQTNNIIKESVGTIEDFDLVISATSYTLGNLLRMGQTDKGKLFSRWLGLITIEEKERIAKELWKNESSKLISKTHNRAVLESELLDMKKVISNNEDEINVKNKELIEISDKLLKLNNDKVDVLKNLKTLNSSVANVDVVSNENRIKSFKEELEHIRGKMKVKKERYFQIEKVSFNQNQLNDAKSEEQKLVIRQTELRMLINSLKEKNENLLKQDVCVTCGQHIDEEAKNNFVSNNNQQINNLIQEGVENKAELEKIKNLINEYEQNKMLETELNRLKPEMSALKVQIDNLLLNIERLENEINEVEKNKETVIHNKEIDAKINIIDEHIRIETGIKEGKIREIETLKNENKQYEVDIVKYNKVIEKLKEEEIKIRNWNIYQEIIGKNGIIKFVLKKALPILNNEIERLLHGLCDFDVKLSIDENNKICIDLIRDGVNMDLGIAASGWEGCVSSIALRSALSSIATLPKCSILTMDEVLSGVGNQNTENVFELFRRMLPNYDSIIHICHDITLNDYHDQLIIVRKENNISKIEFK